MATKEKAKTVGMIGGGVTLAALVGYLYYKGDIASTLSDTEINTIIENIENKVNSCGCEIINNRGDVLNGMSISESNVLSIYRSENSYEYYLPGGENNQFEKDYKVFVKDNITYYYKPATQNKGGTYNNDGAMYWKDNKGNFHKLENIAHSGEKITGDGLPTEGFTLSEAQPSTNVFENVTFRELKDKDNNIIGLYREPDSSENGELYINGKWYKNLSVNGKGQLVDSSETELGSIGSSDYNLKIGGVDYKGNAGAGVSYQAIISKPDFSANPSRFPEIVGYKSVAGNGQQNMVLFDSNGYTTNGIVTIRQNLTEIQEYIVEAINSVANQENSTIAESVVNELTSLFKGQNLKKFKTFDEYSANIKEKLEDLPFINKLSIGTNEMANAEAFQKFNELLQTNITDPASLTIVGFVVGITALAGAATYSMYKGSNHKHKVFSATSLNSSYGNHSKSR